ncbi:MAG: hypothetical protein ACYDAC_06165 [Candidatus Dormibacteria bacterium]
MRGGLAHRLADDIPGADQVHGDVDTAVLRHAIVQVRLDGALVEGVDIPQLADAALR